MLFRYPESENKFLKDDIFNNQKPIDKLLENNNKLVEFRSHHVPIHYIQGSQSSSVTIYRTTLTTLNIVNGNMMRSKVN